MIAQIIETIRKAFETRDFSPFVDLFAENGVYETPFDAENNKVEGIAAVRKHFAQMTESIINKSLKIEKVTADAIPAADGSTVFVAFTIQGIRLADNTLFDFPSSVAILYTQQDKITRYVDYPNVIGIKKAAGLSDR
jgi:ketosteroid isomerase-like protein